MTFNSLPPVSPDMKLSPNVGSDRSWVWNVAADYAESGPTNETLAIRFGNCESKSAQGALSFSYLCLWIPVLIHT